MAARRQRDRAREPPGLDTGRCRDSLLPSVQVVNACSRDPRNGRADVSGARGRGRTRRAGHGGGAGPLWGRRADHRPLCPADGDVEGARYLAAHARADRPNGLRPGLSRCRAVRAPRDHPQRRWRGDGACRFRRGGEPVPLCADDPAERNRAPARGASALARRNGRARGGTGLVRGGGGFGHGSAGLGQRPGGDGRRAVADRLRRGAQCGPPWPRSRVRGSRTGRRLAARRRPAGG